MAYKQCTSCREVRPNLDFPKPPIGFGEPGERCKACVAKKRAAARKARRRKREQERLQANEEINRERYRRRLWRVKKTYGLSQEEYEKLVARQGNACAVCGKTPDAINLHIDHCHQTNHVRGMLCSGCNAAAGQAGDSPEVLRHLALYLELAHE